MTLPFPDLAADHPANKIDPALLGRNSGAFAPKLSFAERCACLALLTQGVNLRHVAVAFGVNRRTLVRMEDPSSDRYRDVRDEMNRLGVVAFQAKYVTEEAITKLHAAKSDPDLDAPYSAVPAAGVRADVANQRASGNRGITLYKGPGHDFSHRIDVQWRDSSTSDDDSLVDGWYVCHMDVDGMSDVWHTDTDSKAHLTSQAALKFGKRWLDENV